MRTEGPFGDHTGFIRLEGEFPCFNVELRDAQKDPIYLTTVWGAAAGRFLHGVCGGARVPAGDEDAVSRDCGRSNAGEGIFHNLDDCGDPEIGIQGMRGKS